MTILTAGELFKRSRAWHTAAAVYGVLGSIVLVKIVLMATFSSYYLRGLFLPFITHFVTHGGNTWEFFYHMQVPVEFPYHPLMLYLLSFFYVPLQWCGVKNLVLQEFVLKIPTLLADLLITWVLFKSFPARVWQILLFYCACPIIIYAVYMHSQLDLVPTAFLFLAIYLLQRKKIYWAAGALGLAMSCKFHIMAAVPLMAVYVARNYGFKRLIIFTGIPCGVYLFFVAPYLFSEGFYHLVLANKKQMMLLSLGLPIGSLRVYLPVCALCVVYGRFLAYKKINNDLLDAFLGVTFSLFVLLIIPAPAWYVWMFPFLSIFFIRLYHDDVRIVWFYLWICGLYLIFFIFFYQSEYKDLFLRNYAIDLKITSDRLRNFVFTLLDVSLLLTIYALYKFGVRSNDIYKKKRALVIGIGGDSGAGKSTLMGDIKEILGSRVTEIEGDGDHRWERGDEHWQHFTHLDPKANFIHRQAEQIFGLKQGHSVARIHYNHATGKFTAPEQVEPNEMIILSGLHPFYLPKMRKMIDVKVYLDPEPRLRMHWKIVRDAAKRGYTKEKVIEQIRARQHDTQKYIEPQKEFADLVVHFFTQDAFEVGDPMAPFHIHLKIVLDSSIKLELLLHETFKEGIEYEWDYEADLKRQYLIIMQPSSRASVMKIARLVLPNIEELVASEEAWQDGYRGFIQLIMLLTMSEKMREADDA